MVVRVAVVWLALTSSLLAEAQIYEWRDSTGARNFTNDIEDVPLEQRDAARIVIRANTVVTSPTEVAETPLEVDLQSRVDAKRERHGEVPAAPRLAQVVYDNSYRFARSQPSHQTAVDEVPTVNVNIAGPLSVSQIVVPQSLPLPIDVYDFYGYGGRVPLGLRPHRRDSRGRDRTTSSPPSVLSPAPISAGSPAFMPAMGGVRSRPVVRR